MDDFKQYLQIINQSPTPTFWKNSELYFIGCNKEFLTMVGVADIDALARRKDISLPWASNWEAYQKDDMHVLQTGEPISRLEEIPSSDGGVILSETTKHPIWEDGKIIGIVGFCKDVTLEKRLQEVESEKQIEKINSKLTDLLEKFVNDAHLCKLEIINERLGLRHNEIKTSLSGDITLSKREVEIIYYLSLYKSPKEISKILSLVHDKEISVRSVQTIISDKLYLKFDVHTTGQLIERAAALNLIPLRMPS
ncbi:helix-turn-helix transcriptional regulator [Chromobacterium alticapitis]|uniref:PAS fold-4 domain-containing protein n=1 Tax=Chromobacterium alticapitis TaxID=2073169 RepID=A0A2S5DB90_9NEIS|nr:PAS domain-containing protein [Chromobacterium alticapitis]POZ60355.1 hypothetical protein C2I19_19275 [Chromobacterium alticapitis]